MNCIKIAFVRITIKNERILLLKYLNESKKKFVQLIILRKLRNINIKQFLKFKMYIFKYLIRKKYLFQQRNKTVFMRKIIDNLIIKTQIFEIIHKKSDYKENFFLLKNRDKIFLIRNYTKCQTLFKNL